VLIIAACHKFHHQSIRSDFSHPRTANLRMLMIQIKAIRIADPVSLNPRFIGQLGAKLLFTRFLGNIIGFPFAIFTHFKIGHFKRANTCWDFYRFSDMAFLNLKY